MFWGDLSWLSEHGYAKVLQPVETASVRVGEALERLAGKAQGLPADLAQQHDEYRRLRRD